MADYYWQGFVDNLASRAENWSASSGGAALTGWPGTSPDASDNFHYDQVSPVDCTWESSMAAMNLARSIQMSVTNPYTGTLTMSVDVTLQGLILNSALAGSANIFFNGLPLSSFQDSNGRNTYIKNGEFADISSYTGKYSITAATSGSRLDNGPYPNIEFASGSFQLGHYVPTSSKFSTSDDDTIHFKGSVTVLVTASFSRTTAPDMSLDTSVKINFDTTSFTYSSPDCDFVMSTVSFRGIELPVTGAIAYGTTTDGFTCRHYGIIVNASTPGEVTTIRNGTTLDCFSLEIKPSAIFRNNDQSPNAKPTKINTQTEPIVNGVWSFNSSDGNSYLSPKKQYVADVASGGTGRTVVRPNSLLIGNQGGGMQSLSEISVGANNQVLTVINGVPTWSTPSGGGGGGGGSMSSFTLGADSGAAQTIEDGNVLSVLGGTGISSVTSATDNVTLNLDNTGVVAGSYTLTSLTVDAQGRITSASNGSLAGDFLPKFHHDQTPGPGTPFSPFRILQNFDTLNLGAVNVFSPTTTATGLGINIPILSAGNVAGAGRELLFYGSDGTLANNDDSVNYTLDTFSADGVRSAFIAHMSHLQINTGIFTTCYQTLIVHPMPALFQHTPSVVRVVDTGIHSIIPRIISSSMEPFYEGEEPENVRIFLIVDYNLIEDRGRFQPNFNFLGR